MPPVPILCDEAMREIDALYEQIAHKIFATRLRLKLRQKDVAGMLSMSIWQLSKYERHVNRPKADLLVRLARIYNVSIMDLLPSEVAFTATPISAGLFKLFVEVEELGDEERRQVENAVRETITRVKAQRVRVLEASV